MYPTETHTTHAQAFLTLLVVDDDELVAERQKVILEEAEYRVRTACSSREALSLVAEDSSVDLVLMDIELNEALDGRDLAQRLLQIRRMPIVFLTQHTEERYARRSDGIDNYGYILKDSGPFVIRQSVKLAFRLFEAQEQLRESRDLYQSVTELTGDLIIRASLDGRWTFINRETQLAFGLDPDDAKGREFWDYVHPEDRNVTSRAIEALIQSGEPVRGLVNRNHTLAGWRTHEWNGAPIKNGDGNMIGFQATGRDISDREERERELRLKNHAIESSANGIVFADPQRRISYANPAALRMWGYADPDVVIGRQAVEFLGEPELLGQMLRRVAAGEDQTAELTGVRADGTAFVAELTISAVRDETAAFIAFMAIIVDVSERRQRQEEIEDLLHQRGVLLRELRHRIKNDLHLLRSMLTLQASERAGEPAADSLTEAGNRLAVLAKVYDKVSGEEESDVVSLESFVRELLEDLRRTTLTERIDLSREIDDLPVSSRESVSIGIIINELITNAVKYSRTRREIPRLEIRLQRSGAREAALTVQDNGPGFPEEVLQGSVEGFGLTAVRELVRQFGGTLQLSNTDGARVEISGLRFA